MGIERHHAIVVSTYEIDRLKTARSKAKELGCVVSEIVKSPTNGICSFLIAPDGSKEGWDISNIGDTQRDAFVDWIREEKLKYNFYDWAEIMYGSDDDVTEVTRHSKQ